LLPSKQVGTTQIVSEACYLAVFDRLSPANRPGAWDRGWRQAKRRAGRESWAHLWYFNGYWAERADAGEVLAWVLVFDGVFQIRAEVFTVLPSDLPERTTTGGFLAPEDGSGLLECPSGEIVVDSLGHLGDPTQRPILVVSPGLYRLQLFQDEAAVHEHSLLESPEEYPEGAGPDWVLRLAKEM
jgi:hypothetical protein